MAAAIFSGPFLPDFLGSDTAAGKAYLKKVFNFKSKQKDTSWTLKDPAGATLKFGGLEDTIYSEADEEVNAWGKFYLPEIVQMEVIGVVEGTSCPCDQLVLMTCENRKIYAYDGEELHLVASSLSQLESKRIEYPARKSYYNGEAFQDMTEDDWEEVKKGAVGRRLDQAHQKLVKENESAILKSLKSQGHT